MGVRLFNYRDPDNLDYGFIYPKSFNHRSSIITNHRYFDYGNTVFYIKLTWLSHKLAELSINNRLDLK